jgi:hypothetical protein
MDRFQDRYRFASASFQCHYSKPEGLPQGNTTQMVKQVNTRLQFIRNIFARQEVATSRKTRTLTSSLYSVSTRPYLMQRTGQCDRIKKSKKMRFASYTRLCELLASIFSFLKMPYRDCLQPFRLRISSFERCNFIT